MRAAIELAKDWRTDRMLRRLEALLIVADAQNSLLISGTGDVIEPEHDLLAIGSGGAYAQAAAQALYENTRARRARDRREGADDRGQDLHLHEHLDHRRGALAPCR